MKVIKKSVRKELKKKASHSGLSKFRKSPKKKFKEAKVNQECPSPPVETDSTGDVDTESTIQSTIQNPNTSTILSDRNISHSSEFVVETISELDGDDSFDISGNDINYNVEVHSNIDRDTAAGSDDSIEQQEESIIPSPETQTPNLIPRKLTFGDVVLSLIHI